MSSTAGILNELCEKLSPLIKKLLITITTDEDVKEALESQKEFYQFLIDSEPDPILQRALRKHLAIMPPPSKESIIQTRRKIATASIIVSWSEVLRWAAKGHEKVRLRDCLLPENLGRAKHAWDMDTGRLGLTQEQIENLLRDFAKAELEKGIQLTWGGFVTKDAEGPLLICESRG